MHIEPIDYKGKSIGCITIVGDLIFAITPSGTHRNCADKSSAVWYLKEIDAGRDPEATTGRSPRIACCVFLGWFVVVNVLMYGPLIFK